MPCCKTEKPYIKQMQIELIVAPNNYYNKFGMKDYRIILCYYSLYNNSGQITVQKFQKNVYVYGVQIKLAEMNFK